MCLFGGAVSVIWHVFVVIVLCFVALRCVCAALLCLFLCVDGIARCVLFVVVC